MPRAFESLASVQVLLFDDSYLHSVAHRGTEDRYVLYVSVWQPSLPSPQPASLHWYASKGWWHPHLGWEQCKTWRESSCIELVATVPPNGNADA